jgi:heme-degrading monooxygenase HmoA
VSVPGDEGAFRVMLRMQIKPGQEEEFERTWAAVGDAVTRHRANLGQWLARSDEERGVYYIASDWVDEPQFRQFEHSEAHRRHRALLHPLRTGGSMTTAHIVAFMPGSGRAGGPAGRPRRRWRVSVRAVLNYFVEGLAMLGQSGFPMPADWTPRPAERDPDNRRR